MKNIIITAFAAILGAQVCFADALTTGQFAGSNVLDNIGTGGAVINGHTQGLTGVTTNGNNASLHFNNDTRIDWGSLNVGGNQQLHFQNGNNAVLNNVLNGMSTFAGKVTGEGGAIIISNPNGMLLQGGVFETAGSIVLTTKDLLNHSTFQNGKLKIDWDNAEFKDNGYSIISLVSSKIKGGDINIISKGINIDSSDITANNSIVFKTTDGSNFIAEQTNTVNDTPIQIANSSIKNKDGAVQFLTNGNVLIKDMKSDIKIADSNIGGNLNITSNKQIKMEKNNIAGDTDLTAKDFSIFDNTFNGNIKAAGSYPTGNSFFLFNGNTVGKDTVLTALEGSISTGVNNFGGNINITNHAGDIIFHNAKYNNLALLSAKNGTIKYTHSNNTNGTLFATAQNIDVVNSKLNSNSVLNSSNNITIDEKSKLSENISLFSHNDLTLKRSGDYTFNEKMFEVKNNLNIITTGNLYAKDSIINSNTISFEGKNVYIDNLTANNLSVNNFENTVIVNSKINKTAFKNGEDLYLNLENSSIYNNSYQAIKNSAENVQRIHFIPEEIIIPDIPSDNSVNIDSTLSQEPTKILNTYKSEGVDSRIGSDFAPIAFAAYEENQNSFVHKIAGDKVFKDLFKTIHITERFNLN